MMIARKRTLGLVAAAAVAGTLATGVLTTGTAEAAPLPGASGAKKVPGGSVSIRLFDESFTVQRPVAHVPTSREVHVSGKVRVTTTGSLKGGTVTTGYLIGCQLDFGARSNGNIGLTSLSKDQFSTSVPGPDGTPIPIDTPLNKGSGVGGGFTLAPGAAKFVPVIKASIGGQPVESFTFTGQRGGVAYSQERFGVDGCAGFAQARALVNVKVANAEFKGNITLYGRPFSIG